MVDFSLQPGGLTEELVVTADAPLLQTGTGTVGETLKSDVIENLPINGRDYTVLARLTAGVVPPQPGARAPLMFSANGVRPAQNNYLLDGIDNNTSNVDFLSGVAYIVKPPVDAVDEIKILTSSFSAEYGRAGGAVLNTTLKSGTNQLRGSVWEFHRNDALNANDFFANRAGLKKGEYLSNQFGFTAGGPAIGSKTFWFADYEGSLIKQARTWVRTGADGAAARQRLHRLLRSHLAAERQRRRRRPRPHVPARHGLRSGHDAAAAGRPGRSGHGHASPRGAGFVRDPFAGNQIPRRPPRRQCAAADAALPGAERRRVEQQLRGEPATTPTTRTRSTSASITTSAATTASSPATASRTTTRCGRRRSTATATAAGSTRATRRCASTASRRATHMFSPTLINEARFGVSREHTNRLQPYGNDTSDLPGSYGHPRHSAGGRQRRPAAACGHRACRSSGMPAGS